MNKNICVMLLAMVIMGASLMGCGKKNDTPASSAPAPKQNEVDTSAAAPALPSILTLWQQGDTATAVSRFVETDWNSRPLFTPDSVLSMSEEQFKALPASDRDAKSRDLIKHITVLKQLVAAVAQAGQDAAAKNDPAQARKCFTALKECGQALDSPDALLLLKVVGQGIKKRADAEMSKLAP